MDHTIAQLLGSRRVDHISPAMTVLDAVKYMAEVRRGAVPVIDEGRLVGMFSERDLMLRVVQAGLDPGKVSVGDVMSRDLVVAQAADTYADCLAKMQKMHFRHLPVVDGKKLVGLISLRDLMQLDAQHRERHIEMLNYYVGYSPEG